MKKPLLLFLTVLLFAFAQAQPANDDPCNAIPLTISGTCNFTQYTNAFATASSGITAPGCASYSGADVWFTVTVPAGGSITFDSKEGVITDGGMAVYTATACNGTFTLVSCNDDASGSGGLMPKIALTGQTPGTTLYVRFWEYGNDNNGTFYLCASAPTPATNDEPCTSAALPLTGGCASSLYSNVGATATPGVPAPGCGSYSGGDVWFSVVVPASGNINLVTSAGTLTDCAMAVYSGTCSGSLTLISCNDDASLFNDMPKLSLTGQTPGATLFVRVWDYGNNDIGTFNIGASDPSATSTVGLCSNSEPFCTGTSYNFPANADCTGSGSGPQGQTGPDYHCLLTQPNPVWYYMQIENPGDLHITLTNSNNIDVDFCLWGPFSNINTACGQLATAPSPDCSYSTSAVEYIDVTGAQTGEYYLMVITNFANQPTNFIFSQTSGTASTNCQILCNMTGLTAVPSTCNTSNNTYSVSGTINVQFPPTVGTLTISSSCGQSTTLTGPFTNSINYTLTGLTANGAACSVKAVFSADTNCKLIVPYTAPAACSATCSATASNTGPYCAGQTVSFVSSASGTSYSWSGPVSLSAIQSPTLVNATAAMSGTYTVTVTYSGGCTASASTSVSVTAKPNAGLDQTVSCGVLPGGTATMAGSGIGTWTVMAGNPGTATITTPTSPTTTITNFSAAGTYNFTWSNGSCIDTAQIVVTAKPNAGVDQTVSCVVLPGGNAIMAATGTGTWTAMAGNPGTATITTPTSPTTTITSYSAAGTYNFIWTNGGCSDTAKVVVTAKPNAGVDQTVSCVVLPGGSATMAATGTGTWTAMAGNPGTAVITTPTSPTTTITSYSAAGTYNFIWTNGSCSDTAKVVVTAKPNAGIDQTVNCVVLPGGSATMAATGTGTWTAMAGNPGTATISTPTSPTTSITNFSAAGTYNFVWTNGGCSDTAQVVVTAKPNAGIDQTVSCVVLPGGSATMAATGTGTWTSMSGNPGTATIITPTSPTTSITNFSAAGTYYFIWTNGSCSDTAQIIVNTKANAGPDQSVNCVVLPGGSATMAATGTGTWTSMSGNPGTATIITPTSPTTSITNFSAAGTYYFIWTNGSCSDTAQIIVNTKANAGPDQSVNCVVLPGGSATMAATGTGTWTAMAGNPGTAVITTPTSPTTTITSYAAAGTYNFIWTNGSCNDTAKVVVTAKPNAGVDQTVSCVVLPGGNAIMAATGTGTWTAMAGNPGTATITTPTSPTTTITSYSAAGTYNFIWTNGGCSDTAKVVVTAKPNAGIDQTVSCVVLPGGSATMAATGTGTWTAMSGNAGSATITTATSPTTSITNFSAAGTYNFIWTNGGCSDTAKVVVTAKPNAGVDQTVNCVVLPGGSATMAATGTGTWTAMSGNAGSATITTATSPTTSITNFSAAGTYNFIWTNGGCSDTAQVVVTAKPNAGVDQTVSCVVLPGGSATMAATGAGTWTAMSGNPGSATIATATSPTTSITNFSAAGTYNFIWTNGSCSDTASVIITSQPDAGNAQSSLCQILPGGNVTMNGSGNGVWSAMGGNPGTATITTSASPTTSILNFSAAGTYYFIYANGSCSDTATVTVTAQPEAGSAQSTLCQMLPGGNVTMNGSGSGVWSAAGGNPGIATINSPASPTTSIINFSVAGTYQFIYSNGTCHDTAVVLVSAKPDAGSAQSTLCQTLPGGMVTMNAIGTGVWTAWSGNPGTANITSPSSPTTSITSFSSSGTYNFIWTNGSCSDTASVTVTALPEAGPPQSSLCQILPGGNVSMNGSGSGTWSALTSNPGTATIATPSSPNTTILNFTAPGTYAFVFSNGSCNDTATVTVKAQPDAGNPQSSLCQILPGGSVTMNGSGSGNWSALAGNPGTASIISTSSPTTAIQNFSAAGTYIFVYSNATCSDTVQVAISEKPQAGSDQFICQHGTITTAANSSGGVWSPLPANPAAVTILNATSTSSSIGPFPVAGNYGFIWTANSCTDTMMVTVKPVPAIVDNYQSICTGYSYISPGNHVYTITGNYYDTLTAINGCDSIILTHLTVFPAQVFASGDTNICKGSSAVIHASGALYYQWTPNIAIDSVQSANPMVNPSQTTTYIVTGFVPGPNQLVNGDFSSGNNGFSSGYTYNPTDVTLEGTYAVNVNANNVHSGFSTCTDHTSGSGNFMVVNGSATPNSVVWQQTIQVNPGTDYVFGAWVNTVANGNPALLQFSINGSLLNTPFQAPSSTCNWSQFYANWNSGSNSSATITIVNQNTTLGGNDFGLDDIFFAPICFNKDSVKITVHDTTITTIDTSVCQGTNYTLPKGNVVQLAGTYIDTFATIWGCDSFVITNLNIKANPTVQIIPDTICNGQLGTLNSIVNPSGGVYNWLGTGNSSSVLSVSPSSTTSYILIYTSNGCSTSDTDQIVVNPVPVILVNDTAICSGYDALLHTSVSVSGGNYLWSSGAITPNITLHPGATTSFTVFYEVNGCADTAISHVTVNGVPAVTLSAHAAICTTDNGWIAATVAGGSPQYHYNWQPAAPDNDSIFNLITGSYQLIVVDSNHCSDTAAIVVGRNFPAVTIALQSKRNIRCFGTATGAVDIDVSPVATYNYVWNTLPAQITQDVTGLTQGNYTVIATDSLGCADTATFNLTEPSALIISGITKSDPLCYHGSNGTATVTATGGSGGYHYSWNTNPAQHTATAVSLSAQTYTATVTDDSACAIVDSIQLNNPPALILNEISNRSVSCNSGNDGESQVATTNGTPPYAYVWNSNPVQHDSVGNQLPSGTYSVSVSDFNSCTATLTVTINEPQALAIVVQPFGTHCFNGADGSATATVTGGVAPYHYLWSNGDSTITADSLIAGTISVTASDAHGCSISASSNISQPTAITNQVSSTRTSCYNISDGTITCTAAGGTGSFQFALYLDSTIFINSNSSGAFTQLARGNYWILISDGNGCQIWTPVHVPSAPANSYSAIGDTTSCFGVQYHDATIVINSNEAANSPFSYTLDGIITQPNGTFVNVGAGNHQVLVSDKFGCDTVIVVPVIMPEEGVINILPDTAAIYLGETVQLNTDFTPYLASSISNYHWSPSVGLSCADCADPQFNYFGTMTYHLTVTYNGQCTATDYITIHVENDNRFYIPNVFTPNGDGANDVFYVYGKAFKQITMKIFNRWGEKVFESNSEKNGWDGSFKGEMQEPGVYVYEVNVTFIDNKTVTQTGSVTLLK